MLSLASPDRLAPFHFILDVLNAASFRLRHIYPYEEDEKCKESREDQEGVLI